MMKVVSFFAGAGGLDLGFEKAGFVVLVVYDCFSGQQDRNEYSYLYWL